MNATLKGSMQSRLVWLGLITTVLGYIQANIGMIQRAIPDEYFGYVTMGIGILTIVFRFMTTTSLAEKSSPTAPDETPEEGK
jgi:hypothetical protein